MNGLKLAGAAALLAGLHPMAALSLVGLGAAAYAPAKPGLVTHIVPSRQLLAAHGKLEVAVVVAMLLGTVGGGMLVVPLNALLQHRGCQLPSAGRSIAVQGFNENASVLAMLAGCAAMVALDVPLRVLMTGFGLAIAGAITLLWLRSVRRPAAAGADERPAAARPRNGR